MHNAQRCKIGAIVVARMTSSRFPGKSLAKIADKPLLEWLIIRLKKSRYVQKIVIATTTNEADQPIENSAKRSGVLCFRGSEDDVLGRVLGAAKSADLDVVIHITADCPLIDPAIINQVFELFFNENADYAKNFQWGEKANPALNYPNGLDVEVFRTKALAEVDRKTKDPWLREHVTEPLYTWPQFKAVTFPAPEELARPEIRICVDTKEDFVLVSRIFKNFVPRNPYFSAQEIISFLDRNPELKKINVKVSQEKYSAAVIGLGMIGSMYDSDPKMSGINTHSGAYQRWSKTRLVGGCDPDGKKRKAFTNRWGVKDTFSNVRTMLAQLKPEIVSICTPSNTHAELVRLCVESGVKAILCEKPFVTKSKDGEPLLKLCQRAGVILAVNHWMRYSNLYQNVKKYIIKGGLGTIRGGRYHYSKGVFNSGSHAIDLLLYLLGDIVSVRATDKMEIDTGDINIGGILEFANGAVIHLTAGNYRHHFTTEIDLMGTKGRIRIADNERTIELYKSAPSPYETGIKELARVKKIPFNCNKGEFMLNAVANLVDALEKKTDVYCSGEEGLKTIQVIELLHRSLNNHGRMERL